MDVHYRDTMDRGVQYLKYDPADVRHTSHIGRLDGRRVFYTFWKTPLSPESKKDKRYNNRTAWYQTVAFLDFDDAMSIEDEPLKDRVNIMATTGNIALNCDCPAFRYYGYKYIITSLEANTDHEFEADLEGMYPKVRNPDLKGVICKHLALVLRVMPFWIADFAGDINRNLADIEGIPYGQYT